MKKIKRGEKMLDRLFVNGRIYSLREEGEMFEALGVEGGKIAWVGSDREAVEKESKSIIDLGGRTMIPALADSHMHMYAHCQNLDAVDLAEVRTVAGMVEKMQEKARRTPPGEWIKGVNFDQTKWEEDRFPTLEEMDAISNSHPIILKRCCLHAVVANSLALKEAGIGRYHHSDAGGLVELDEQGFPTGLLREQSTKVFDEIIPDPLRDENYKKKMMLDVMRDMSSKGITTIHTYAAKIWRYNEDVEVYRNFDREGLLPLRVTVCMDEFFDTEDLDEASLHNPYRRVQMGAYKIFSDGSMGSRSAALREDYSDDEGNRGFVIYTQEELNQKVCEAYERGMQSATHAIGDRALDMTLTAIEYTLEKNGGRDENRLPFRIIHAQMTDEQTIERMKNLPLVVDIQPVFLCTDLYWVKDRIGEKRLQHSYAFKSMYEAGLIQTGGSDCPVESYAPLKGIHACVNRQDVNGYPEEGFLPGQRLSVYEALRIFSANVHYATGQQDVLGTLEVGKFADMVVLDRDIFEIDPRGILGVRVDQTYLAGDCVFDRKKE